jgi:CubicO group peptidase (beta-lactamase class C family)
MPNALIQPLCLVLQVATLLIVSACGSDSPVPEPDVAEQVRRVETGLLTHNVVQGESGFTVQERMRFYRVPGVSVAVIKGGEVLWARAWGEVEAGSDVPVDTATLFQAASISKPVAAAGALRLVEQGVLELDTDVNLILRSWQLPDNRFTATEKVTVRRLLSHSAGTTVHGFPGYAAGEDVPSLAEVLDGDSPANTAAVRVDAVPGSQWRYSGGGTSIVQLLMEDASGRPFADLMQELVLDPAGMGRSTFAQPLPAERLGEAATAHGPDGTPIAGKHHTYPEQAAAGLWTTPSDLARFAVEIQRGFAGSSELLLSPAVAREMLTPEAGSYGLGFSLQGEAADLSFEHGGANAGFRSHLVMFAERGDGAVVMTNGDGGAGLAAEILRSIAREYDYPTFQPTVREAVDLLPSALADFVGDYFATGADVPPGPLLRIRLDGDDLYADVPPARWTDRSLRASSERTFFFLENAGEVHFEKDGAGAVIGAVVSGLGEPIQLVRR